MADQPTPATIDDTRVGVLGVSVDQSTTWTTGGPAGGRNALNPLASGERVITRVINALDSAMGLIKGGADAVDARFNVIVGDEGGPDQQAFDDIGMNLIQAVAQLMVSGPGGGGTTTTVTMGDSFTVTNPLGGFAVNDVVSTGDVLFQLLRRLLNPTVPPTYVAPVLSLAGPLPYAREIGEELTDPVLTPTWTQNDGGPLLAYRLFKDNVEIFADPVDTPVQDNTFQLTTTVMYRGEADFDDGPILDDSENNPDPNGQIMAGTTSSTVIYQPQRMSFYGALDGHDIPDDSAFIRTLAGTHLNAGNGTQMIVDVPAGERGVCFAYPANLRAATSIVQRGALNMDVKSGFTELSVNVPGANNYLPTPYRVYYIINAFPFTGLGDRFTLTV